MGRANMWAVVVLGLLATVQQSMQMSLKQPSSEADDGLNPTFALVTTSSRAEKEFLDSSDFLQIAKMDYLGRTFVFGTLYGVQHVFVRTAGNPTANMAITVQILVEKFNVKGIIHFGSCGATDRALSVGTVVIPRKIGYTGNLEWLSMDSNEPGQLQFAEYNIPQNGGNRMGSLKYNKIDLYYNNSIINSYWIYTQPRRWMRAASLVKIDSGDVVVGVLASSSDIFVKNAAYGSFISKTFGVSIVDKSSGAAGLGAKTNTISFISIQGVSNHPGKEGSQGDSELATKNVVKALLKFVWQITVPRRLDDSM